LINEQSLKSINIYKCTIQQKMPRNRIGGNKAKRGGNKRAGGSAVPDGQVFVRVLDKGQLYGQVVKILGGSVASIKCNDGQIRNGTITGKMRKRVWMRSGDVVVGHLEQQGTKEVLYIDDKCGADEVKDLNIRGIIHTEGRLNDIEDDDEIEKKVEDVFNIPEQDLRRLNLEGIDDSDNSDEEDSDEEDSDEEDSDEEDSDEEDSDEEDSDEEDVKAIKQQNNQKEIPNRVRFGKNNNSSGGRGSGGRGSGGRGSGGRGSGGRGSGGRGSGGKR
jgi:initiation factor 1A